MSGLVVEGNGSCVLIGRDARLTSSLTRVLEARVRSLFPSHDCELILVLEHPARLGKILVGMNRALGESKSFLLALESG